MLIGLQHSPLDSKAKEEEVMRVILPVLNTHGWVSYWAGVQQVPCQVWTGLLGELERMRCHRDFRVSEFPEVHCRPGP